MRIPAAALALALLVTPALAQDNVAAWVQYAPGGGGVEARVATTWPECPRLSIDGRQIAMAERAPPNAAFAVRLCSLSIPQGAKKVSVLEPLDRMTGTPQRTLDLPVPTADPRRILVLGDTGCRIKGGAIQDCNDPKKWPFPEIAAQAAKLKPDLVVHVGDYLYREAPCPNGDKRCAGTPWGDNWPSWDADFFTPAAPLLAAAPWVITRGNHEDCERSGPGFLRLLGPNPVNPVAECTGHLPLYLVPLGDVTLAVMDDADAPDTTIDSDLRTEYETDFSALAKAGKPLWLVMHRPIWGAVSLYGMDVGGNRTLIAALPGAHTLDPVSLMLAGHIHTFEALNYKDNLPPTLIAGFGGDALDTAPADLSGINLSGTRVKDGVSIGGFGFLLLTKEKRGWRIDVHKRDGSIERVCRFANRRLDCPKA